jgi:RNA polymerase sigma-70 factor (subfamily 1)
MKYQHRAGEVDFDTEFLLVLARAGDRAALDRLLERYRNYIGLLIRLQGHRPLLKEMGVECLIHEIGLEIRRKIATFRGSPGGDFLKWVRRRIGSVLANQACRLVGETGTAPRGGWERALIDDLDRSSSVLSRGLPSSCITRDRRTASCEHAVILADALGELPDAQREVIILRNLERFDFPDVARSMGCSEEAAKNVWLRALARLHCILEPSG